jgi:hypothetical protein
MANGRFWFLGFCFSKTAEGSVSRSEVLEKLAFARTSKRRSEAIPSLSLLRKYLRDRVLYDLAQITGILNHH